MRYLTERVFPEYIRAVTYGALIINTNGPIRFLACC